MAAALALLLAAFQAQDEEDRIRWWVRQLESDEPRQREEAAEELVRMGERVIKAISAGRNSTKDAEAKARLDGVLRRIRQDGPVTPERLRTTVLDLRMPGATLTAVAREVHRLTGIAAKFDTMPSEEIDLGDLDAKRISIEALLNQITDGHGFKWGIDRGESIAIMPRDVYLYRYGVNRALDVRDLLQPIQGADRLKLGVLTVSEAMPIAGESITPVSLEKLAERIREESPPGAWENDPYRIDCSDGFLKLRNLPGVCDDAERAIARCRETCLSTLYIRLTLIAARESALASLRDGGDRLKEALASGKEASLVAEQEVATINDVPTFAFSGKETTIVADYTASGDPARQVVRDGLGVALRATSSGEGKKFRISGDFTLCRLEKIERFATKRGDIQMPTLSTSTFRFEQGVAEGQATLALSQGGYTLAGPEFSRLLVFVRVSRKT